MTSEEFARQVFLVLASLPIGDEWPTVEYVRRGSRMFGTCEVGLEFHGDRKVVLIDWREARWGIEVLPLIHAKICDGVLYLRDRAPFRKSVKEFADGG